MESSVMTPSSSHRLRSAMSACAQPTNSYLKPSCLGSSFDSGSRHSGGCYKKFDNSDKNEESPFSNKLNITKKPNSSNDCSYASSKKSKNGLNHCGFSGRIQSEKLRNVNIECIGKKIANELNNAVLNGFPKNFKSKSGFLSKIKQNGSAIDGKKKLYSYLSETSLNKTNNITSVNVNCKNGNVNSNSLSSNKKNSGNNNGVTSRSNLIKNRNIANKKCNNSIVGNAEIVKESSISDGDKGDNKCRSMYLVQEGKRSDDEETLKWQPKHTVTRRTAQISREVHLAWEKRVGSTSCLPSDKVQVLFNDLELYPSESQVFEMLECAKECSGRPSPSYLTFGEFCVFATELKKCYDRGISRPTQLSRLLEKDGNDPPQRNARKLSKSMCKYEVFLGGSCNPTTWRTDVAIPLLNKMGISFYNPQVSQWRPELLEAEYLAKENATVMFFVIDNQTRGVSALIEVAHLAGCKRKLILVIQSFTQQKQSICGEPISEREYEDLKNGQQILQDLVERQGIPVFDNIVVALNCTERVLRENLNVQELDLIQSNKLSQIQSEERPIKIKEAFDALDSSECGKLTVTECCHAFKLLTNKDFSIQDLKSVVASQAGIDADEIYLDDLKLNFEQFCSLVSKIKSCRQNGSSPRSQLVGGTKKKGYLRDVYLGGTGCDTCWRETLAIPILKKNELTFFNPKACKWNKGLSPIEASAIDNSRVLLFVITNTSRSVGSMALAGHYIGLGYEVVLCVQHIPEGAIFGSEKLSQTAIKDYNRGRMYLMDIGKRSGVPVFANVSEAVECVVQKCKNR